MLNTLMLQKCLKSPISFFMDVSSLQETLSVMIQDAKQSVLAVRSLTRLLIRDRKAYNLLQA